MSSPERPRRVGVFGGTFDPPHIGHLLVSGDAAERLQLDLTLWLPVGTQPLKREGPRATGKERLQMVELTVGPDPRFSPDRSEILRGGLSFTIDTLAELRDRFPAAELFLLIGEDSWRTFEQWREPERIRELARLAILTRDAGDERGRRDAVDMPGAPLWLETRRIDVSATEIRQRVRTGRSIRGFVTDAVEHFIFEHGLYK